MLNYSVAELRFFILINDVQEKIIHITFILYVLQKYYNFIIQPLGDLFAQGKYSYSEPLSFFVIIVLLEVSFL